MFWVAKVQKFYEIDILNNELFLLYAEKNIAYQMPSANNS